MRDVIRARAPASTANIGPGFDCAGAALELWNELEIAPGSGVVVVGEGASEVPADASHLGLQAFASLAPLDGYRFTFSNGIPLERGLGSSAATIVLGLVAGAAAAGVSPEPHELLELALRFEDHPDNVAAALLGGVCLAWHDGAGCSARRVADRMPLAPLLVIPPERVSTVEARAALPTEVSFADATHNGVRAAMLGAAVAGGDSELFVAALDDRLHEPYRAALSKPYSELRSPLPEGACAVTISGSGPSTVVWCEPGAVEACRAEVSARLGDAQVLVLEVSPVGAGVVA